MSLLIVALLLLWSIGSPPVQVASIVLYVGALTLWSLALVREERRQHGH